MVSDVDLQFMPRYGLYLAGASAVMYGFVVAYETARRRQSTPMSSPMGLRSTPDIVGAD